MMMIRITVPIPMYMNYSSLGGGKEMGTRLGP